MADTYVAYSLHRAGSDVESLGHNSYSHELRHPIISLMHLSSSYSKLFGYRN